MKKEPKPTQRAAIRAGRIGTITEFVKRHYDRGNPPPMPSLVRLSDNDLYVLASAIEVVELTYRGVPHE